jgi:hypothetical protein
MALASLPSTPSKRKVRLLPRVPLVASKPRVVWRVSTPALSVASCTKSRPFSGRSTTRFSSITWPTVGSVLFTSTESATTLTVSLTLPTSRTTATSRRWLTTRTRPVSDFFLNPPSSASSWYSPGCRAGKMKVPSGPDTTVRDRPVRVLVSVTVAPGTRESLESRIAPEMDPANVCASPGAGARVSVHAATATRQARRQRVDGTSRVISDLQRTAAAANHGTGVGRWIVRQSRRHAPCRPRCRSERESVQQARVLGRTAGATRVRAFRFRSGRTPPQAVKRAPILQSPVLHASAHDLIKFLRNLAFCGGPYGRMFRPIDAGVDRDELVPWPPSDVVQARPLVATSRQAERSA